MTRIVQLANFYGPCTGGLRTVVEELAAHYTANGIERTLIAPGPTDAEESDERGTRIFVRAPVLPASGGYRVICSTSELYALLESVQPDAIEVSDKLTLVATARWARERGIPCTLLSHERIDAILRGRVPRVFPLARLADFWNVKLARRFDTVLCPSRFAWSEFGRIGASNAAIVPWGVDLDTFAPSVGRSDGSRRAAVELICVGRLSKEKAPELAVGAAAELQRRGSDVHLTMVGDGPMREALERRSKNLPVTFTGHVHERHEVARLLASADVTVAPCPVEAFGLSVLESLACGTPVVTSESGASSEVSGPDCGIAAPPGAGTMAEAVRNLLDGDVPTIRRRARERAEEFPWTRAAESVMAVHLGRRELVGHA